MTLYLEEIDVVSEVAAFDSSLIVVCRFCPATSLALKHGRPYLELFRRGLNTGVYEAYISDLQRRLHVRGVGTDVLRGNLLNFIICMWTPGQRRKLLQVAKNYDAVVVLGCDVAYETVSDILADTDCQVFHGMACEGVLDAAPQFRLPGTITLEKIRVASVGREPDCDPVREPVHVDPYEHGP